MRKLVLLVVLGLIVAACGGADDPVTQPIADEQPVESTAPETTVAPSTTETVDDGSSAEAADPEPETTEPAGPSFDGPPAPDFELALADGSTFRLSDEQKPVYLVFWAEW